MVEPTCPFGSAVLSFYSHIRKQALPELTIRKDSLRATRRRTPFYCSVLPFVKHRETYECHSTYNYVVTPQYGLFMSP